LKRICFVIPSLSVGGTERQLIHLMRGLVHDNEVTVICTRKDGALAADARRLGAYVRVLDTVSGWDPRLKTRIRRVFRNHRPDIVHTFLSGFDHPVNRAARETGVPVVISSRRELATWMKPRHVRLQRRGNRAVDCVVANSGAVAKFALQQERGEEGDYRVIPNGIDVDTFVSNADPRHVRLRYRIPFHTHVVGIVANFSPVKDHPLFLEVARELLRRRADCHFFMAGTGPLRQKILRRVRTLGLSEQFTCAAPLEEVQDLYRLMAVSVLCSKMEGFPNVVMEAMASGTPTVAPAVGGIPELIEDGATGRLVDARDPPAFADAIEWVLDHPEESRAMGERASEFVRAHLSLDRMVSAYRTLYAEFLANASRRGA
jgi:glycosyltransferase involved in cell wall biosynthesis